MFSCNDQNDRWLEQDPHLELASHGQGDIGQWTRPQAGRWPNEGSSRLASGQVNRNNAGKQSSEKRVLLGTQQWPKQMGQTAVETEIFKTKDLLSVRNHVVFLYH